MSYHSVGMSAAHRYGRNFVRAMQAKSADGRTQRVVASPKHYVDYDLEGRHDAYSPGWGPSRNDFNAIVSQQEQVGGWYANDTMQKVVCGMQRNTCCTRKTKHFGEGLCLRYS